MTLKSEWFRTLNNYLILAIPGEGEARLVHEGSKGPILVATDTDKEKAVRSLLSGENEWTREWNQDKRQVYFVKHVDAKPKRANKSIYDINQVQTGSIRKPKPRVNDGKRHAGSSIVPTSKK